MADERWKPDYESKWQAFWAKHRRPAADGPGKKGPRDFYMLSMFPYPSGRLHFGHALPYTLTDSIARFKRMNGFNVLNPMGWDAFGLPAENAAIEAVRRGDKNVHPARMTYASIEAMREQMHVFGYSFDWDREVHTCKPDYYRWTQWLFLKMYERGVAYRKKSRVNWCPDCKTTLANEQVETHVKDGDEFQACFRCGNKVEPREIDAWFLRITDYADRLLNGLDTLQASWPELVTSQQRNWIGRSEGVNVDFQLELRPGASGSGPLKPAGDEPAPVERECLTVFTTRADTTFGVTFVAIAPEHPLVERILALVDARTHKRITEFVKEALSMTEQDRASGDEKEGVATGMFAINPLNDEKVPVFVANYVLMYGTGAVMAVPGHDERDHDFAREYRLPIKQVITPTQGTDVEVDVKKAAFTEPGVLVNSGVYSGLTSAEAIARIGKDLNSRSAGGPKVHYKLRDWGISRQRYWGCPIPVIHCDKCGIVPVPESELPVRLPDDVDFLPTGRSPLTLNAGFQKVACPKCGNQSARRDTDTMDTFVDSSWYFLRYTDPHNDKAIFDPQKAAHWTPVDLYVGGREHAILHLIYARFFTKFVHDLGLITFDEPFTRMYSHGLVQGESRRVVTDELDRYVSEDELDELLKARRVDPSQVVRRIEKMSKSKRNGADPTALVAEYGADAVRLTILFMAPAESDSVWDSDAIKGPFNFLRRWHELTLSSAPIVEDLPPMDASARISAGAAKLRHAAHSLIERATGEFEGRFAMNTVIAGGMELANDIRAFVAAEKLEGPVKPNDPTLAQRHTLREAIDILCRVMAPFAPHTAEETHEALGGKGSVFDKPWPKADAAALVLDEIELPVQVNGKVRGTIRLPSKADKAEMERLALNNENVKRFVEGKAIQKLIVVPGRIINVVAK